MQHLQTELDQLLATLPDGAEIRSRVETLVSVYPFNEFEFIISHLLARDVLSLDQYLAIRDEYLARNMYLYIFEISAPRTFGESWAQGHLKGWGRFPRGITRRFGRNGSLVQDESRFEVASRIVDTRRKRRSKGRSDGSRAGRRWFVRLPATTSCRIA